MDRSRKLELVQRSLGIKHKLKVYDSLKAPETHEELAKMMISKWELEDELRAIEELLTDIRNENVNHKKADLKNSTSFPGKSIKVQHSEVKQQLNA